MNGDDWRTNWDELPGDGRTVEPIFYSESTFRVCFRMETPAREGLCSACPGVFVNARPAPWFPAKHLKESQTWYQLAGSLEGGFREGTMASAHLDARHFSFSL